MKCNITELEYRSAWKKMPRNISWSKMISKADVLEKYDQGFLWCKVPKAASESWTSIFIKQWFKSKRKQLMWQQQVYLHQVSKSFSIWVGYDLLGLETKIQKPSVLDKIRQDSF